METVYLYLIGTEGRRGEPLQPVKIGISSKVESRLATIQTGSPRKLCLLGCFRLPGRGAARHIEKALHAEFQDKQTSGEWFSIDPLLALSAACEAVSKYIDQTFVIEEQDVTKDVVLDLTGVTRERQAVLNLFDWRWHYCQTSNVTRLHGAPSIK